MNIVRSVLIIFGIQCIYFANFITIFIIHRNICPEKIIFYSGIIDILLSLTLNIGLTFAISKIKYFIRKINLDHKIIVSNLFAFIFVSYSFVITIPSLLDRSISIFLITAVAESGSKGISDDSLQHLFLDKFVNKKTAINKRLDEQVLSNHFIMDDETYYITKKGHFIYLINQIFAIIFNIDDKFVKFK